MAEKYQLTIMGEASRPAPGVMVEGHALQDGERAHVDLRTAVALIERGLAVPRGKVEIEAVLKPQRGAAVMVDDRACFAGDRVEAGWAVAHALVARGRASLAEGARLPRTDPEARR